MGSSLDLNILKNISHQEKNLWEFYFLDLPSDLKNPFRPGNLVSGLSDLFSLGAGIFYYKYLVQNVSFSPIRNIDYQYDAASRKHYPTSIGSFSDISMEMLETETFASMSFLKNLYSRTYSDRKSSFRSMDPTIIGILVFYKKTKALPFGLGRSGFDEVRRDLSSKVKLLDTGQIFLFNKMKIKPSGSYSLDYSGGNPLSIQTTFSVEEITEIGASALLGSLSSFTRTSEDIFSD